MKPIATDTAPSSGTVSDRNTIDHSRKRNHAPSSHSLDPPQKEEAPTALGSNQVHTNTDACEKRRPLKYKDRFLSAMLSLLDTSRGTLWMVAEPVWIRHVEQYVDRGRKGHLGLSIRSRRCIGIGDMIPMLIGTSRPKLSAFSVTGCFGPRSKRTTFFRLRPCPIPFSDAYDEELGVMIRKNPYKNRLTEQELSQLNVFLSGDH